MSILVLDTAVVLDLHRGALLQSVFALEHHYLMPDLSFDLELDDASLGAYLQGLGLHADEVSPAEMSAAQADCQRSGISLYEAVALAMARRPNHELVTDGVPLKGLAAELAIPVHGLVDLLEEVHVASLAPAKILVQGLLKLGTIKPERLDDPETEAALERWVASTEIETKRR